MPTARGHGPANHGEARPRPHADGGRLSPVPGTAEPAPPGDGDEGLTPRQCGRCRERFPGDPTLHSGALAELWFCPPCRLALLGEGPGRPVTARGHTPVGTRRGR